MSQAYDHSGEWIFWASRRSDRRRESPRLVASKPGEADLNLGSPVDSTEQISVDSIRLETRMVLIYRSFE
jgi:hypothetical protein